MKTAWIAAGLITCAGMAAADGEALYAEHCAACHGAELEGQTEWRTPNEDGTMPAPPHDRTGHTWHHGDAFLFDYTKLGGQETLKRIGVTDVPSGMPAFAGTLSDQQILEILAFIKSTWPERERQVQEQRSRAERQ